MMRLPAVAHLLAAGIFGAIPSARAQSTASFSCSELLAGFAAAAAEHGAGPESALADAWAQMVFSPESAAPSVVENWAKTVVLAASMPEDRVSLALNPPGRVFALAEEEGFSQLRGVLALLEAQDRLDLSRLSQQLESRARDALAVREAGRVVQDETQKERRRPAEPVRRIQVGARKYATVLKTRSGNLVISSGNALVFTTADGSLIRRVPLIGEVDRAAVQLSDGRIVVGTGDGVLATLDESGNLLGFKKFDIRPLEFLGGFDAPAAELGDGTIVIGGRDGWVYLVRPNGEVKRFRTEGEIQTAAIALPGGGGVIGSSDGVYYFFSGRGRVLKKVESGAVDSGTPILLGDGNLFAVNHSGLGVVMTVKGEVLSRFQVGRAPTAPIQLADGRIAMASWYSDGNNGWTAKMEFFHSDGSAAYGAVDFAAPIVSGLTQLSNGHLAFADQSGLLRFLDEGGREVTQLNLGESVYGTFVEVSDGAIVAGTENGSLVLVRESALIGVSR